MRVNKNIRLRTEPGLSKNISVKLEQEFDTLDFLSLQITQQEAYRNFCSDYGVVAGRVIANDGFGIGNAKVSIFIPLTDEDAEDPVISQLYPYTTPIDQNEDGVRYNLLPRVGKRFFVRVKIMNDSNGNEREPTEVTSAYSITSLGAFVTGSLWEEIPSLGQSGPGGFSIYQREVIGNSGPETPVGTLPTKFETLDDDTFLEVYEKYYKLSTRTNASGDYMIFGVPTGTKTVHMDVDLSDTGSVSLTPADFISQGFSPDLFTSELGFPSSTNLDSLPQIESQNISVDVIPFWGDIEQCEIGITRLDFSLNKKIVPSALLVFQAFTNADGFYLRAENNNVVGPDSNDSDNYRSITNMVPLDVTVACTRGTIDSDIKLQQRFEDGNVIVALPMYSDFKVTDENGELVDSIDGKGVPTGGQYSTLVWGTQTRHIGVEKNEGTALHNIYFVKYRYDLLNRKRLIYTPGISILSKVKNTTILSSAGANNRLSYPSNTVYNGASSFGSLNEEWSPVFGSLYFPKHKQDNNGSVNENVSFTNDSYGQFGGSTTVHVYDRSPFAVGVLDITDILYIFKPFGGDIQPTSANNELYGNPPEQTNPDFINSDDNPTQGNQTLLLRGNNETSSGEINFPNRLNELQINDITDNGFAIINPNNGNGNATRLYGSNPSSGQRSQRGRYYLYFGLDKNNNILEKLKTQISE